MRHKNKSTAPYVPIVEVLDRPEITLLKDDEDIGSDNLESIPLTKSCLITETE